MYMRHICGSDELMDCAIMSLRYKCGHWSPEKSYKASVMDHQHDAMKYVKVCTGSNISDKADATDFRIKDEPGRISVERKIQAPVYGRRSVLDILFRRGEPVTGFSPKWVICNANGEPSTSWYSLFGVSISNDAQYYKTVEGAKASIQRFIRGTVYHSV
jgi:hypothetical protein